jgi:virulence-associated protein VapD
VHKPAIPLNTIRRIVLAAPPNAELEIGFEKWLRKVVRISAQTKAKIQFIGSIQTLGSIEQYFTNGKISVECDYEFSEKWNDYRSIGEKLEINDLLIIVSARKGTLSYSSEHDDIPKILSRFFFQNSFIILYPEQKIQTYQPDSNLQFEQGNFSPFSKNLRNIDKFRKMVERTFQTKNKFKE